MQRSRTLSKIPSPQVVAEGRLPSVAEKRAFVEEVIRRFSTAEVKLVLYGSIARGDATLRSDIDLCATPPGGGGWASFDHYEIERWAADQIAERGWDTNLSVLNCASKRGDAEHNRQRFADPSGPIEEARFSITTFDHFGYLARDSRFSPEIRRCYAAIQQDIRKYTGTNKEARLRDLAHYVVQSIQWPGRYLLPIKWREYPEDLAHLGWAENVAYHVLRKLGGITKTLKGSDAKASLAGCFESRGQVVDELLHHFGRIRQFGFDIEEVLARTYGRPEHIGEYEAFLDQRLPGVAEAAMAMLNLLHREIEEKTLLETVADYDRQQPKTVILADRFLPWLEARRKEGVCTAVHWWCVGDKVYVDAPVRAYVEYKGEIRVFASSHFEGKKLNSLFVTAEGRVEINLGPHPRPNRPYVYARPIKSGRPDYQQAARLAHEAVIAKLREILPADISITAPSP